MQSLPQWVHSMPCDIPLETVKYYYILHVLANYQHNRTHAAKALGLSIRGLRMFIGTMRSLGYSVPPSSFGVKAADDSP